MDKNKFQEAIDHVLIKYNIDISSEFLNQKQMLNFIKEIDLYQQDDKLF